MNDASEPSEAGRQGENVTVKVEASVAILRFVRTAKLNPLDWSTIRELRDAIREIEARKDVTVVVVTGSGRSFSAGGDLDGYLGLYRNPDDFSAFLADFGELLELIERSRMIYVAAVNGVCVAGGLELLLACDLVLASADARIGDAHLNFGQLPGAGGSQRLPRAIGALRAKHLILTGRLIPAEEAMAMGLVNEVFPAETFEQDAMKFVGELLSKSGAGLRGAKHLVNYAAESSLRDGLRHEIDFVHDYATSHPDAMEGLLAFRDKRRPKFA